MTYEITFPRIVLAEVVTHRILGMSSRAEELWTERTALQDLSKNSASSRAIPLKRMIDAVVNNPYVPERFSRNQAGMQEKGWLEGEDAEKAKWNWLNARDAAVFYAEQLHKVGVHKQDVNRLLEPWGWVKQIITGTEWANFFALRTDKDAHPAFRTIARMMYLAKRASEPRLLDYGEWHVPYVGQGKLADLGIDLFGPKHTDWTEEDVLKVSAARCAWVSYDPPGVDSYSIARAFNTYDRLMGGRLKHVSPVEHQATPHHPAQEAANPKHRSNLRHWLQFRKLIAQENVMEFDPSEEEIRGWLDESQTLSLYQSKLEGQA